MSQSPPDIPIEVPAPSGVAAEPWGAHKVWGLLKCFGPAAILASLSVGAGETIVVVRTGAWAGYALMWVVVLSCLVKGTITYMLGRYTAMSGESIGQRLVRLPGPRGWFLLSILFLEVLFAPLAWVAIARPCGNLVHFVIGYNFFTSLPGEGAGVAAMENLYTTLFIILALGISLSLNYDRLEKKQIIICGILVTGTLIGTFLVRPDIGATLEGMILRAGRLPDTIPASAPEDARNFPLLNLATLFAYVGMSVTSYVAYASWVRIRGWGLTGHPDIEQINARAARSPRIDYLPDDPEQRRRLRRQASPMRWDILMGSVVLLIVTVTFMMAGAAALYGKEGSFSGWSLLTEQSHIWRNIHPWLVPIYYITVLAALFGTLTALPEVYARVSQEFLAAIWTRRAWSYTIIKLTISAVILIESVCLIWADVKFDTLTQLAGFFTSNLAVAAIAVAAFYLNAQLPRAYRTNRVVFICAILATVVLVAAACLSAYGLFHKLAG